MPEMDFTIMNARSLEHAAIPTLVLSLGITAGATDCVQNVLLQCQIQIESTRRRYERDEQAQLVDLFGTPERWSETLRSLHWTRVSTLVPAFEERVEADLQVPCTFDFNVAATKYFYGLEQGEIPLLLLFSGTIFYREAGGALQVRQIPWSKEARYRLPVSVWKQMMDHYYPNSAWLCLRQDVFESLYQFKCQHGIPTWEQALQTLLAERSEEVRS